MDVDNSSEVHKITYYCETENCRKGLCVKQWCGGRNILEFRNWAYLNVTLKYCRVEIYHGSPRSLLYLDEPIEGILRRL